MLWRIVASALEGLLVIGKTQISDGDLIKTVTYGCVIDRNTLLYAPYHKHSRIYNEGVDNVCVKRKTSFE